MVEQGRERTPEQSRERLASQPSTQDDGRSDPAVQTSTMRRPGLVTFAAIMMIALGGFHVLLAISEFANSSWLLSGLNTVLVIQSLVIWGIIDLIIALVALYAGVSILQGGAVGWILGYTFATLGVIRWLFSIPVSPVLAVVVIVLDVLVMYGLVKHFDYFQTS